MGAAMDDQRLVALAQEGNPDAFSLLVERHQTMVYNLALGKTGSPQDAEEVTQTARPRPPSGGSPSRPCRSGTDRR